MKKHILLIDDDESLGLTLKENLEYEDYKVTWIQDGKKAIDKIKSPIFDLIVLDVMLPEVTGLDLLIQLRMTHSTPVLMISAKGSAQDRIKGLMLKADDYLPKPFHLKEFILRVQSQLRRSHSTSDIKDTFYIGPSYINLSQRRIILNNKKTELLTEREAQLLHVLYNNNGNVISRDKIIASVWKNTSSTRTVDNCILRLRKFLEPDPSNPKFILSQRGVGYSLNIQ